jgi:hypothetical protein
MSYEEEETYQGQASLLVAQLALMHVSTLCSLPSASLLHACAHACAQATCAHGFRRGVGQQAYSSDIIGAC